MGSEQVLKTLLENPTEVYNETVRILVKIADNIIKNPHNLKIRSLQKANNIIHSKIINVKGATECLKLMGFVEVPFNFLLKEV